MSFDPQIPEAPKVSPDGEAFLTPAQLYMEDSKRLRDFAVFYAQSIRLSIKELSDSPTSTIARTMPHPDTPFISELLFQRFVDNFLTFVSGVLTAIFTRRPEMLKSGDMISVKDALEYETRTELISVLTERKVIELSFKGLTELNNDLVKRYDLPLFEDKADLTRAAIMIEKRNLLAHNRGLVNRRYLERVKPHPKNLAPDWRSRWSL